ncbi:hypothetical protein [Bradyrhizobium cenepequi]
MQFAIMVWIDSDDAPDKGSIFGITDKNNPVALPTLSPTGYWADFRSIDGARFKYAAQAKKAISQHGYYLLGASVTIEEAFGQSSQPS